MIRRAIAAAFLRREPYLVMVVRPNGVADGAIVVAAVFAVLAIPVAFDDVTLLTAVIRLVLSGLVNWIVLSGLVYLIGRHLLEGDGSFQATMAATSIGYPVLLAAIPLAIFVERWQAQLIVSLWLVATVWVAARVALDLPRWQAAAAAIGGWAAFVVLSLIFRF